MGQSVYRLARVGCIGPRRKPTNIGDRWSDTQSRNVCNASGGFFRYSLAAFPTWLPLTSARHSCLPDCSWESRVILAIAGTKKNWPYAVQFVVFGILVAGHTLMELFFDMRAVRMIGTVFIIMILMSFSRLCLSLERGEVPAQNSARHSVLAALYLRDDTLHRGSIPDQDNAVLPGHDSRAHPAERCSRFFLSAARDSCFW